jgi:protein SCO1
MALEFERNLALVDHHGRAVSGASFRGRHALLFFGFTHCRVVCPEALSCLSQALDLLGEEVALLQPLYISVDPDRDTPELMRKFLETRYPRFLGLTGSCEQIDAMKRAFKVYAERTSDRDDPDGYAMPHTAFAYLIDPKGRYVRHFGNAEDAVVIAKKIRAALAAGNTV